MSDYGPDHLPQPFDVASLRLKEGELIAVRDRFRCWVVGRYMGMVPPKPAPAKRRDRYPKLALKGDGIAAQLSTLNVESVRCLDRENAGGR